MKVYLCVFMAGATAIFFSYIAGVRVGREKCHADLVSQSATIQSQTIKIIGDVNAETFNRGVADIRRVLYEKYTIAE